MMRIIGWIIAASIALAALRVALAVALALYLGLLVAALITRPQETIGILGLWLLFGLFERQPLLMLVVAAGVIAWCLWRWRRNLR
ncbi:MAG TPA: hypothetical protein VJM34_04250 [Novosphingobium sp.]|nr:hypothetical protein [Novosphingobium sp.]